MKLLLLLASISLMLSASEPSPQSSVIQNNMVHKEIICKDTKFDEVKQRGCCSWHGGVSGCSGGRVTCNDGTYSPSCTCAIPVNPLG